MNNVPNLDDDVSIDLMAFWKRHQNGRKRSELFPDSARGSRKATRALANYASNLHTARACRERGDISAALAYEEICQVIYKGLPPWARW